MKILIVHRGVWDDAKGTSSMLINLFGNRNPDDIAQIYFDPLTPNTVHCNRFFQISEGMLFKKLFKWNTVTGYEIRNRETQIEQERITVAERDKQLLSFSRKYRSYLLTMMRDLLWLFNGWKSKELEEFIISFNPDIVWLSGSPLILTNRLGRYVADISRKPSVIFLQDDAYTYKSCYGLIGRFYRTLLRPYIQRNVMSASHVFTTSPKMKREFDEVFGISSSPLMMGCDVSKLPEVKYIKGYPIRLVYLGNVVYGRINTLTTLSDCIDKLNDEEMLYELDIYTANYVSAKIKKHLSGNKGTRLKNPVPFSEVPQIIENSDVYVVAESLLKKENTIARLSFSTKIVDGLASGRAMLAIGPRDCSPMEYLTEHNAAFVAENEKEIECQLLHLVDVSEQITKVNNARQVILNNHNIENLHKMMDGVFNNVINDVDNER